MITKFLRLLGIDRRTPEEKARDGVKQGVREHEKNKAKMAKRLQIKSFVQPDSRQSLKVIR